MNEKKVSSSKTEDILSETGSSFFWFPFKVVFGMVAFIVFIMLPELDFWLNQLINQWLGQAPRPETFVSGRLFITVLGTVLTLAWWYIERLEDRIAKLETVLKEHEKETD